jgi:cathepsin A (carboxypeptidase C)
MLNTSFLLAIVLTFLVAGLSCKFNKRIPFIKHSKDQEKLRFYKGFGSDRLRSKSGMFGGDHSHLGAFKLIPASALIPEAITTGYVTVNSDGDDLFFWLSSCRNKQLQNPPLIIWLTGGPGCASSFALITENGPFLVNNVTGQAAINPNAWNTNADLMFVDQPIRTGFSHGSLHNLPETEEDVREMFAQFLLNFMALFPQYKQRDLYITGESYAGHFIPHIANKIVVDKVPVNLKGVAIGNGWTSPQSLYPSYNQFANLNNLFQAPGDFERLQPLFNLCSTVIERVSPRLAMHNTDYCESVSDQIIVDANGDVRFNYYNIKLGCPVDGCYNETMQLAWLNNPEVQRLIGVDKSLVDCDNDVYYALTRMDWTTDAAPQLVPVLEAGLKVLAYNGDLDWICNWVSGDYWTGNLTWAHTAEFNQQQPVNVTYGMSKKYENFEFVRFFGAGHMVPMDKGPEALTMINGFIGAQ